jgi:hypothetical protein
MGGNALSSVATIRLPAKHYREVAEDVLCRIAKVFPERRLEPIRSYAAKPDFGDLDLLLESEVSLDAKRKLIEFLHEEFAPRETFPTLEHCLAGAHEARPVVSFDYSIAGLGAFQVDLILTPPREFDFARNYFAWNDLGNLIGVVAQPMGLKFGHAGLFYPLREGTHQVDKLLVTRDFHAALRFLGFDSARFEQGFNTTEDIFAYAVSSPYFVPENYQLEDRSSKARVRDRKRKTYMDFLEWLERHPGLPSFSHVGKAWLPELFMAFPDFQRRHEDAQARVASDRALRLRFNGERIGAISGAQGPELGRVMERLRQAFPDRAEFAQFFMAASDQDIAALIEASASPGKLPKPP